MSLQSLLSACHWPHFLAAFIFLSTSINDFLNSFSCGLNIEFSFLRIVSLIGNRIVDENVGEHTISCLAKASRRVWRCRLPSERRLFVEHDNSI